MGAEASGVVASLARSGKPHLAIAQSIRPFLAAQHVQLATATEWVARLSEAKRQDNLGTAGDPPGPGRNPDAAFRREGLSPRLPVCQHLAAGRAGPTHCSAPAKDLGMANLALTCQHFYDPLGSGPPMAAAESDPSPSGASPIQARSSRDNIATIHDGLRGEILNGDLRGGTVLSQVRLAQQFGVSRGPVREALRLLQSEGLVDAELNHRARVAEFSADDLEQLYAMRILNETLALIATVPRLTQAQFDTIHRSLEEMDALAGIDMHAWEASHRRFHRGLVAHAGPRLLKLVEQLSDHAERYRRAYIASDVRTWSYGSADHHRIYDAAERRDALGASNALAEHLARTALTLLANAAPHHDPVLVRGALRNGPFPDESRRRGANGQLPEATVCPGVPRDTRPRYTTTPGA